MFMIYDNFVPMGYLLRYTTIKWIRRFNDVGEFEITKPFNKDDFLNLLPGTVIYHEENDEAGIIENISCYTNALGEQRHILKGKHLSGALNMRISDISMSGRISDTIKKLLNENFISPSNRNRILDNFVLGNLNLSKDPGIETEYTTPAEVIEIIKKAVQPYNIGFKVSYDFNNKKFIFSLIEGKETNVEFNHNFRTVNEQELYIITGSYKNTCLVDEEWVHDNNRGWNRYETFTNKTEKDSALPVADKYLEPFKKITGIDSIINNNSKQYEYRKDWNLGDVVTCGNDSWDIAIKRNILEITEFYERGKFNLSVVFGDNIPISKE